MSDIAKTMANRIVQMSGGSKVLPIRPDNVEPGDTVSARELFVLEAASQFEAQYGVQLQEVATLFVPRNDFIYTAAEAGVPVQEFVRTLGRQLSFDPVSNKDADLATWTTGENRAKFALFELAASDVEWTFSDGFAVGEQDGYALVVSPSFDETISAWQFSAFVAPCAKDEFLGLSKAEKFEVPAESRTYGDIDDCVGMVHDARVEPVAMRM